MNQEHLFKLQEAREETILSRSALQGQILPGTKEDEDADPEDHCHQQGPFPMTSRFP